MMRGLRLEIFLIKCTSLWSVKCHSTHMTFIWSRNLGSNSPNIDRGPRLGSWKVAIFCILNTVFQMMRCLRLEIFLIKCTSLWSVKCHSTHMTFIWSRNLGSNSLNIDRGPRLGSWKVAIFCIMNTVFQMMRGLRLEIFLIKCTSLWSVKCHSTHMTFIWNRRFIPPWASREVSFACKMLR